jgi:chromosome segregation ATPase
MTAVELHSELDKLRGQVTTLQAEHARYVTARDRALAVEPGRFNQNDVDGAKRNIVRVERQIADVQERIAALKSQLPTPDQIRKATSEARALSEQAQAATSKFTVAWTEFLAQIEAAVVTAHTVATARTEGRAASAQARDLIARFALDLPVPEVPTPDHDETQIAGLVGVVIRDVGYYQIVEDVLERELTAARVERARRVETVAV